MKKFTCIRELNEEIETLQLKQVEYRKALNEQVRLTAQSLRPVNLIKSSLKDLFTSPDLKDNLVNSSLGIGAGYITNKVITGASHNPIKKIIGTLLQLGVTNLVSNNGEVIKSGAANLFKKLFANKKQNDLS